MESSQWHKSSPFKNRRTIIRVYEALDTVNIRDVHCALLYGIFPCASIWIIQVSYVGIHNKRDKDGEMYGKNNFNDTNVPLLESNILINFYCTFLTISSNYS